MEKIPDPKELEKELSDYLTKKYGSRIKVLAPHWVAKSHTDGEGEGKGAKLGRIKFDLKPEELETYLNEYVINRIWPRVFWPPRSAPISTGSAIPWSWAGTRNPGWAPSRTTSS
jgi:hypothetical protein